MTRTEWAAFVAVLTFPWAPIRGDTDVSCVFMQSCTLPCSAAGGADVVVNWFQVSGNLFVHLFYDGKDQLALQNQRFRGRTALFREQLPAGNASLQLSGVKVQDEGRYRCYSSSATGSQESFINLKMDAPVHEIEIQRVGNSVTCSSEGIYPPPNLTWSTRPPSNVNNECKTGVRETEQQLYNISSSVTCSDSDADLSFICTISTRRNERTATLPSTSPPKPDNSGAILGGVIAAIIVAAVAAAVVLMLLKRRREQREGCRRASRMNSDTELQPPAPNEPAPSTSPGPPTLHLKPSDSLLSRAHEEPADLAT